MSLTNATSEISAHPGKNSVTHATDRAAQAADVDRKMRLYGVIEAFRAGKVPDNQQIDETLQYVKSTSPVNVNELSPDGQKLISDSRDIIETARLIVKDKNADELFQNFLWHTTETDFNKAKVDTDAATPITKDDAKKDGRQAIANLRTLLTLVLTNSEARKLLSDIQLIGRDLFARGAIKAGEKARPTQEQLAQVDDAAPSDNFASSSGPVGTTATPQVGGNVGGRQVTHDPKTGNTIITHPDGTTQTAGSVGQDARATAQAHIGETRAAMSAENPDGTKKSLKERIVAGYNSVSDRIPDERRDQAHEHVDRAKNFFREEFPEDRRDQ
ncbi:hypothetical protein FRC00_009079, partial [Tulasnella sp. 408]